MNNATLFHRWAHQVKDKEKSGNVFYEGPILYSYGHHFPLAVLTGKRSGSGDGSVTREIVLVNTRFYSMTTAKHKSMAVRASSHMEHIYIPHPDRPSLEALDYLNGQTRAACERLKKIRSGVDYAEGNARRAVETAKLYRKTFLKGRGKVYALPKDFDALLAKAREREERHNNPPPELLAKRDKDRIRRDELREAAWRAGEPVRVSWGLPCMLRLKGDDTVETSLGAKIPLGHARRAYGAVLNVMESGVDFESNGHTIPVGAYKVDKIKADGTLTAGCHTITFDEIARFAGERGWK